VKGGIFNPQGTSTLSVPAKPDSDFKSGDTLVDTASANTAQ
jgi:hypothetical protein